MIDLEKLTKEELGNLFPIYLEPYNYNWKNIFIDEQNKISRRINYEFQCKIDHIGSTSIIGIWAKPTIDILLQIASDENAKKKIIDILKNEGYIHIPKPENPPPSMMFVKGYTSNGFVGQTFHIHVRFFGDYDEIYFRDYLNNNFEIAKQYEFIKIELSKKFKNDREAYTEGKTDFVQKINFLARNTLMPNKNK